jgi:hypothetical protein
MSKYFRSAVQLGYRPRRFQFIVKTRFLIFGWLVVRAELGGIELVVISRGSIRRKNWLRLQTKVYQELLS